MLGASGEAEEGGGVNGALEDRRVSEVLEAAAQRVASAVRLVVRT